MESGTQTCRMGSEKVKNGIDTKKIDDDLSIAVIMEKQK